MRCRNSQPQAFCAIASGFSVDWNEIGTVSLGRFCSCGTTDVQLQARLGDRRDLAFDDVHRPDAGTAVPDLLRLVPLWATV